MPKKKYISARMYPPHVPNYFSAAATTHQRSKIRSCTSLPQDTESDMQPESWTRWNWRLLYIYICHSSLRSRNVRCHKQLEVWTNIVNQFMYIDSGIGQPRMAQPRRWQWRTVKNLGRSIRMLVSNSGRLQPTLPHYRTCVCEDWVSFQLAMNNYGNWSRTMIFW